MLFLLLIGCKKHEPEGTILARAGSEELTQSELEAISGVPLDSLRAEDRWRLVSSWVDRALVEQEGERVGFENDPEIREKLAALRAELFRAKLLSQLPASPPADSVIADYYDAHQNEFLRSKDAFLIELYWSDDKDNMLAFRNDLKAGDTTMLVEGKVSSEGKWLAESGELDPDLEQEVTTLKPGEITFPKPYEDGFRMARLLESFPAGTVLDLPAVQDEIKARLIVEQSRQRQDSLDAYLRQRYPVMIFLSDSL